MSSGHDVRQRAVICQDCWFWKEMSCALASPTDGVCANKRPVQGRRAKAVRPVDQPRLTPLAVGHGRDSIAARAPFAADAPESTFSMAQLREQPVVLPSTLQASEVPAAARAPRVTPPSFREIRSGRAAAATRAPLAQVQVPIDELENGTLATDAARHAPERVAAPATMMLPGMEQLVERVRQRTAARLSRTGTFSPA